MNEKRPFFEVFPGLVVDSKLKDLFDDICVLKALYSKSLNTMIIYIVSPRLIHKSYIYDMENRIKKYIFEDLDSGVRIIEKYQLSAQYTLSKLTTIYRDSLLFELGKECMIAKSMIVTKEKWEVKDNTIYITIEDTFIARKKASDISNFLVDAYKERFDLDINIDFVYVEEQTSAQYKTREEMQAKEERRIQKLRIENNDNPANENNDNYINQMDNKSTNSSVDSTNVNLNSNDSVGDSNNNDASASKGNITSNTEIDADSLVNASVSSGEANVAANSSINKKNDKKSDNSSGNSKNGFKSNYKNKKYANLPFDSEVIYGRNCEGEVVDISTIEEGSKEVVIRGKAFAMDNRQLNSGKYLVTFALTDFTDTINCKIFVEEEDYNNVIKNELKDGKFYKVKGVPAYDTYAKEINVGYITGIKPISDFTEVRMDDSPEKRVELHMHTVMSDMDSVVDIAAIIKRARMWGHKAIAITDHGVVQAFPVAYHEMSKDDPLKLIYGVEGYFVDDLKSLIVNSKNQSIDSDYVVFDLETTGLSSKFNKIIEIGAVKVSKGEVVDTYSTFVNPKVPIPYNIEKLTGINDEHVMNSPTIDSILPEFFAFVGDCILVAHNAEFDYGFISKNAKDLNLPCSYTVVDTVGLAHILLPELGKYTLDRICKHIGVKLENHHRAVDDAEATALMFIKFLNMLHSRQINCLDEINDIASTSKDVVKKLPRYHGIILAKNDIGRVNLYRLISYSHIDYFNKRPLMPKSLINKYREGLIIGSACEAGELFKAILNDADNSEIDRLVRFYDYLEIQPLGNDMFMIESDKYPVNSVEDIMNINRRIVKLGEEYNKPVVATCDVHFLDPEDSIYRAIIMAGKGFKDADDQPPLYYRTTKEMLDEFSYLGPDKAKEVVITNTNLIADMTETIAPVRPDKCPPIIENSDETLTNICHERAHEIYGPDLPSQVTDRLERELKSIITNGFAVMYIIAQKLVWKSNDDGYLVGSRGSVGSSFVATMAGITEVNPLSAHYICPKCYYVDFESDLVKSYSGNSGCDMPDMDCPRCGHKLNKEGHDIPFETFLGFKGDKEPDIDLNFSSEYQSHAHDYTEELFGKGKAFRAGTIGTVAEKTAFGYVYNYFEERGIVKRRCEMERIAKGCTGIKRTTGQHPGGMIVLPYNEEIYSFTPIQKPANDMTTKTVTTHFEYHSIDHNLLKLDILGHADPTMIRRLEDLTHFKATDVLLDDKDVMSLFHNTDALKIKPEDISGTVLGCLGVPEFGTEFAMQMLIDTNPQSFSDLVRIAGLAHGTDVWLGNTQVLIQEGKTVLKNAICCRDDIMVYLIHMGLENGLAFTIMESVRKGKGLKPEFEEEMIKHGVPDWYIWSCKKIKYMFPKAHACAYVMMAWRIAYYKVNFPLAYYAAYFSIRAKAFNYEKMCMGVDRLKYEMNEIRKKGKEGMSNVEEGELSDMKLVEEMYARGYEFTPIDIYKADDINFQIINGKIMPPFVALDKMGESAATALKNAAKDGEFLSKDDIRTRAKIGKTTIDKMTELKLIDDLPDSNQLTFNFM